MKNDKFIPVINPLTMLIKFGGLVLFGGLLVHGINTVLDKTEEFKSLKLIIPGIFVFLFFSYIVILLLHSLRDSLKFLIFNKHEIFVLYPLRLKKVRFKKNDIKGFTTCQLRYNIKSVILYSKRNDKIELINKDYLRFKTVSQYMEENFKNLGDETFIPKTWVGRKYKFQ